MFDVLIREMAVRFGLGDKGLPLMQMLLAYMTQKETGGLPGFLEKFKAAGLGPIIQSWLGGGPSAQPVSNSQLETVLGGSGGLLSQLTAQLDAPRDNITSAVGYVLPPLVGKLTPGGSMPSALPPEVSSMAATGQALLAAPAAASSAQAAAGGGMMKWLPWVVVAAAALFGLSYCGKNKGATTPSAPAAPVAEPPAVTAPASTSEPASMAPPASASSEITPPVAPASAEATTTAPLAPASETAPLATSEAMPTSPATTGGASEATSAAASAPVAVAAGTDDANAPAGASVVTWTYNDTPALKVYFDTGKSEVPAQFATEAATLVEHLKTHPTAQAVISGFNDPTGNAALNAELSKNRAKAVQAALVAAGVAEDRTVLEKPADTTGNTISRAAARRVEVIIRP
ncbi:DUF937 domain-containing protein [Comamonadaceae bacterium OH2545_COT-014]|nr:DUF937 domain-containing protein [Comamonadaceae bacterium OH2545_COT-014]